MSRHSKWAKIKRQKTATDVKRGQLFSKLSRAIAVAAKAGGDPDTNPHLRLVMDRALAYNMPKDNITRAIARAAAHDAESSSALTLEAYGPGGAALLVEVVTDNRQRAVADIRQILAQHGGALGEAGSVAWQFERRGLLELENVTAADALALAAIDAGASDIERDGRSLAVTTPPEKLLGVATALTKAGHSPPTAQLVNLPKQWLTIEAGAMERLARLIGDLETYDDVVAVTTNAAPPDEMLNSVSAHKTA